MHSFLTHQPGKGIFTIVFLATLPLRIVFSLLYYAPRSLREHPQWTYHQAVGRAVFKMLWAYASAIEFRMSKSLEPGADKECFITMEPAEPSAYRDILHDAEVRPARIGGMWYPKLYSPAEDAKKLIILHFHGGGYVLGGCRPKEGGWGPDLLAKRVSGFTLCPQYRLATDAKTRFPAAIQDGLTAYRYLLSRGISASDIVLSGDSAGGNLAMNLMRYLVEQKGVMQPPRAVLLWSPWLDLTINSATLEKNPHFKTDYIPSSFARWATRAYLGDVPASHPYVSPCGNEFPTPVPVFLHTCAEELLHDQHMKFGHSMMNIPGNRLKLFKSPHAPHDIFGAGQILGFKQEALTAIDAASMFISDHEPATKSN